MYDFFAQSGWYDEDRGNHWAGILKLSFKNRFLGENVSEKNEKIAIG